MTIDRYVCCLTGNVYDNGEHILFRLVGNGPMPDKERSGVLVYCVVGGWKVLSKTGKTTGAILTIADAVGSVSPASIRKA